MNVLLAPLSMLFGRAPLHPRAARSIAPENASFFLKAGTILCFVVALAGIAFVYTGVTGTVVLAFLGSKLTTGAVGVVLIFMALVCYIAIGREVLRR